MCIRSAICTSPHPLSQLAVCRHRSSIRGHGRTLWELRNRFKQRGHDIMGTLRGWIIASWTLLPGVIAGGTLLLRRVALGDPTAYQITWLRAFHAHGGVLFVLSLVYFHFSESDDVVDVGEAPRVSRVVQRHWWRRGRIPPPGDPGRPNSASIGIAIAIGGAVL